uniref:Uncharacterized protein n=1 Tax=Arundo donax TaxID=35708 RepID=A0A0A9EKU2_ARUDO
MIISNSFVVLQKQIQTGGSSAGAVSSLLIKRKRLKISATKNALL